MKKQPFQQVFPKNLADVAILSGFEPNVVFNHSFVSHDPWHPIIRDPMLDAYLSAMGLCWSYGSSAPIVTGNILPGHLDHLAHYGITPQAIEVPSTNGGRYGDQLWELGRMDQMPSILKDHLLYSSFVTTAHEKLLPCVNSWEASFHGNDKATFRSQASRGFLIPPGHTGLTVGQLRQYALEFAGKRYWLKVARGSGSDFNIMVSKNVSLELAIRKIMSRLIEGWLTLPWELIDDTLSKYIRDWENYLTHFDILPDDAIFYVPIVIELDVRELGDVVTNFCWQMIVNPNGNVYHLDITTQVIGVAGDQEEWWGSTNAEKLVQPDSLVLQHGFLGAVNIAHWYKSIGFKGCIGPDGFLIRLPDGKYKVYWIDPNGRPAITTTSVLLNNALSAGAGTFWNINLTLPQIVLTMEDINHMIGADLTSGTSKWCKAILLAPRTRPGHPSQVVKMFFLVSKPEDLKTLQGYLTNRGIKIGS